MTHPTPPRQVPDPIPPRLLGWHTTPPCPACGDTCTCCEGIDHDQPGEWWRCPACGHGFILTTAGYAFTPGSRPIGGDA